MSDIQLHGTKSELVKVGNPFNHNSMSRASYYTNVDFKILGKTVDIKVKVDTGASYTVVGLGKEELRRFKDIISSNACKVGDAYDASEAKLNLKGYIVQNFALTEDIVIPKLLIYFSEELGEKAVLGMDILSLFDFQYLREKHSSNGTFWINNYEQVLDSLNNRMLNKDIDYIDPVLINLIDDVSITKGSSALSKLAEVERRQSTET